MNPMEWLYYSLSWVLLRWHQLWDVLIPGSRDSLGTTWDWVAAIVFLAITVRIVLFPFVVKQIRTNQAMQAMHLKVADLEERYEDDRETFQQELLNLYRRDRVSPLTVIVPLLIQIPVFLGLLHLLTWLNPTTVESRNLYGWSVGEYRLASMARLFNVPITARFASSSAAMEAQQANGTVVKIVTGGC